MLPSQASTWLERLAAVGLVVAMAAFSLVFVVLAKIVSPLVAFVLLSGMAASLLVVGRPFLGVWLIFATVQQIGWTGPLFRGYYTEIVTLLILGGMAVGTYRLRRNDRLIPDVLGARLAIVLLLSIVASFFVARSFSLAFDLVLSLTAYILLMLLAVRESDSIPRVRLLVLATVLSTLLSSGVAVVDSSLGTSLGQVKGGQQREEIDERYKKIRFSGSASEATNSSKMMLLGVGVAAMMALRGAPARLLYALAALVGCLGIAAAGSRGTFVALGFGVVWMCMKFLRSRMLPVVLVALVVVMGMTIWFMPEDSLERLESLGEPTDDKTAKLRWAMSVVGLRVFMEHPVLGVGPAQFGLYFQDIENRFLAGYQPFPRPLHNMYLAVAAEHGTVALLAFIALIIVALRDLQAARRGRDPTLAVLAEAVQFGLGLYLLAAVFDPVHQQRMIWLILGLGLAIGRVHRELDEASCEPPAALVRPATAISG